MLCRSFFALALLVVSGVAAFAQGLPPWSIWTNQRGSLMKVFAIDGQGNFTGVYINNAQGFRCQGPPGFPLTGHTRGTAVTFTVVWNNGIQNCNSKTIWNGVVRGKVMPTKWVLISAGPPQRGADLFTRLP